jgi:hypothetical protein
VSNLQEFRYGLEGGCTDDSLLWASPPEGWRRDFPSAFKNNFFAEVWGRVWVVCF